MEMNPVRNLKFWLVFICTLTAGLIIAWIDSTPGWDDTGVIAGLILVISFLAGFIYPKQLWIWALLAGIWIPFRSIANTGEFMYLLILLISFAGSYSGGFIKKIFIKQ
jgi:hypothetical protein